MRLSLTVLNLLMFLVRSALLALNCQFYLLHQILLCCARSVCALCIAKKLEQECHPLMVVITKTVEMIFTGTMLTLVTFHIVPPFRVGVASASLASRSFATLARPRLFSIAIRLDYRP